MVYIEALTVRLQIPSACSIKEKRARTKGLRDKWGKQVNMAVVESGYQDCWQEAEWTFVCAANDRAMVDRAFSKLEQDLRSGWDFVVTDIIRERM